MSDGLMAFKGLMWGAGALILVATVVPADKGAQWNPLRTTGKKSRTPPPTTSPSPTPTPTPTSTTNAPYPELTTIPSNFDINSELVSAPLPASAAPDVVGAFRFICNPGQVLADDPIVYPGQPGASHLHQFYGNTGANAFSTYSSLRQTGQSTCMSPVNRSAYWMPAMLDGKGNVVRPDYVVIYYKRKPASDPTVSDPTNPQYEGKAIPLPNGLRFTFGFNMLSPADTKTGSAYFNCDGPTAVAGHYPDLPSVMKNCPAGNRVGAIISAPECWDGVNLDSADHRSHIAYPGYGYWGYPKCPSTHPYVIPAFTMGAWYTVAPEDDTSKWKLSSDEMFPGYPAGYTLHADWFGAWDNNVMSIWTDNCINKMLNCSAGILGNGQQIKMFSGFSWNANPRLVPIPS
jgi:hypothetical protein